MYTDKEFRHYQELYNIDPVVQRLCRVDHEALTELEDQVEELKGEVEDLEMRVDELNHDNRRLEHENQLLREKIQVWRTLEDE